MSHLSHLISLQANTDIAQQILIHNYYNIRTFDRQYLSLGEKNLLNNLPNQECWPLSEAKQTID